MAEEYVSRTEFNQLKEDVEELKQEMSESSKLLTSIDKKIDVINEKIVTTDKVDDLKFKPLEKRVDTLEESQKWLRRTIVGAIITIVIGAIVYVVKMM